MANILRRASLVIALGFGAALTSAPAHELTSTNQLHWAAARAGHMPTDRAAVARPPGLPPVLEYVVVLPNRWAVNQQVHVCFYGGDGALHKRILDAASAWFQHVNLHLVTGSPSGVPCKSHDTSEIRIGFNEPGYWSYIGTDGLGQYLIQNDLSSMNFGGFDVSAPSEPQFSGLVLHEFGHALGFHHEHQSPASGCDAEYDWNKLYAFYQQNYGWDKTMVDQNVRQLMADRSAYDWSQKDPTSIMIYASDPQFLIKGTQSPCYFKENYVLSALDVAGAEKTYPRGNVALTLKAQASNLSFALQSSITGDMRAILKTQLDLTKKQLQRPNQ